MQVSEKRSEAERETRKRERLEKESRDLRAQVDAKNDEVRARPWVGMQCRLIVEGPGSCTRCCAPQSHVPASRHESVRGHETAS